MTEASGEVRRVYVVGPDGSTAAGRRWHDEVLVPQLTKAGLTVLDPWSSPAGEGFALAEAEPDAQLRFTKLAAVNEAALVNLQVQHFIHRSVGRIGKTAKEAIEALSLLG